MRKWLVYAAACLASWPAAAEPPFLVGDWFSLDQPSIKSVMWIAHWEADGGFRVHFRHCNRGKSQDVRSAGRWSFQGRMLTVNTTSVDGKAFFDTDIYETLFHDRQRWVDRDVRSGFVYHATRVSADFQMPSCETIS